MRILIIKPSSLGDIIHALVAAESIRGQIPGVRIDWVARDIFAPIVSACSTVERVYIFERKGGVSGFIRLMKEIRKTRYHAVLDMQGLARSALLARFARADLKIGRADGREGSRFLLCKKAELPAGRSHAVEKLLGFLPPLGLKAEVRGTPDFPRLELPVSAKKLPVKKAAVLFPDSRRPEKEWPHFKTLTGRLFAGDPNITVVWAGQSKLEPDPAWPADRFLNLCGKTSLPEAVALIRHAALAVCNDSGPMHIAAAVGTPVIALFGPTDPKLYGPYPPSRPTHRVMIAHNGDLEELAPEAVADEVFAMLCKTGPNGK